MIGSSGKCEADVAAIRGADVAHIGRADVAQGGVGFAERRDVSCNVLGVCKVDSSEKIGCARNADVAEPRGFGSLRENSFFGL